MSCGFYFLKTLLIIKTITAITAITIKMPTPIPALNIPSIIEQLENEISTIKSINNLVNFFCMILCFFYVNFLFVKLLCNMGSLLHNFC